MVHLIIWVVIGLLALSFFGISLRGLIESPTSQENFNYLWFLLEHGWDYIVAWFHSIADTFTWWE
jgi:hypothetical protein